jgi:hypothetical protein
MKNKSLFLIIILSLFSVSLPSCLKDLDRFPFYGLDSESLYADPDNYVHVLAKLYAGLAISGNKGPAGAPDITGIDEGFSAYVRVLWNLQELPTDEAVCAWTDPGIPELHEMSWNSENSFTQAMYNRIFYQIPLCNEFIRESSDDKLNERGFSDADKATIRIYRAEARFLRALSYYHALDLFGNVPFVTEDDAPGSFFPEQISRADLFNYVEGELLSIEGELIDARQNEYARADKAAAWCLLSRLYLNAEVYTGTPKYTEAITYSNKVIASGYSLEPSYPNLFLADNNLTSEIIFPVTFDGINTKTYGGTTFLVHAPVGGTMKPADFGINGGWAGYRTTKNLVFLFPTLLLMPVTFFTPMGKIWRSTTLNNLKTVMRLPSGRILPRRVFMDPIQQGISWILISRCFALQKFISIMQKLLFVEEREVMLEQQSTT